MNYNLTIFEEILLLGLKDQKGTVDWKLGYINYAFGAAIFAELLLTKKIKVSDDKKHMVELINSDITDNEILNESMQLIRDAKKIKNIGYWINKLAGIKKLKHKIALNLIRKGVLKEQEDKVLFLFTVKNYPEVNHEPEKMIIDRVHEAIFGDSEEIDARTSILVSLIYKAEILQLLYKSKEIRSRKKRIEKIINGDLLSKEMGEIIDAIRAAIVVAVIVPVVAAGAS